MPSEPLPDGGKPVTLKATVGMIEDPTGNLDLAIDRMIGTELRFAFHCRQCGGWLIGLDDAAKGDLAAASCRACRAPFGRLVAIKVRMARMAKRAGHTVAPGQYAGQPERR